MFQASFRLVTVFGIPLLISYSWFIVFLLLTLSLYLRFFPSLYPQWSLAETLVTSLMASLLFFLSITIHEFAHCAVSISNGGRVAGITLFMFGGMAQIQQEPEKASHELLMAVAGPLASLSLAVVSFAVWYLTRDFSEPLEAVTSWLAMINALMAAVNMVPGFPLDGGRVLRAAVWYFSRDFVWATKIAVYSGGVMAYLLISLGLLMIFNGALFEGIWLIGVGWFLANMVEGTQLGFSDNENVELEWTPAGSAEKICGRKTPARS